MRKDDLEGEPVDEVMIGRTGEPFTMTVETGKIEGVRQGDEVEEPRLPHRRSGDDPGDVPDHVAPLAGS